MDQEASGGIEFEHSQIFIFVDQWACRAPVACHWIFQTLKYLGIINEYAKENDTCDSGFIVFSNRVGGGPRIILYNRVGGPRIILYRIVV